MAEQTVQVPVSLIEELGAADDANEGERFYAALRRLRALLSQPTPTAEPSVTIREDVPWVRNGHVWKVYCEACSPGRPWEGAREISGALTLARQHLASALHSRTTEDAVVLEPLAVPIVLRAPYKPQHIDPSTIRDVTPPEVTE